MKAYLFNHDITVKQCAADLGISTSYLYQILKEERRPSLALAIKIEEYTGGEVPIAVLMGQQEIEGPVAFEKTRQGLIESMVEEKLEPIRKLLEEIDARLDKLENQA